MGLGLLGRGVGDARFLAEQGAEVVVTDLKTEDELKESVKELKSFDNISFVLGGHRMEDFEKADMVIKGAGVPLFSPYIERARLKGVPVRMSSALFAEMTPAKVVGVTGTKEKTTVSYLLHHILKKDGKKTFLGGNARLLSTLAHLPESTKDEIAVLELDSWQLQGFAEVEISPPYSVFTNFTPDHMDYYKEDMDAYFKDKASIFLNQKEGDVLVLGEQVQKRFTNFCGGDIKSEVITPSVNDIPKKELLSIPGEHNRYNMSLAVSLAGKFGISPKRCFKLLSDFKAAPGRLEYKGSFEKRKFYNDNNATTPDATVAAIKALKGRIILIAGGADKGLSFEEMKNEMKSRVHMSFVLPGSGTERLLKNIDRLKIEEVPDIKKAVELAYKFSKEGDTILFSPGFASFSQFKNAYQREKVFLKEIKRRFGL